MVQSINNSPGSIIARTLTATLNNVSNGQQAQQKVVDDLANGAKPNTVQQGQKSAGSSKGDLPRGSIVDILA